MNRIAFSTRVFAVAAMFAAAVSAAADLVAYDSFNYPSGPNIQLANGGTGWAGAWFDVGALPTGVTNPGLNWPLLQTMAGCATTAPYTSASYTRYTRGIAPYASPSDTVYISFLFRPNIGYGMGGGLAFGTFDNGIVVGAHPGAFVYGLSTLQNVGNDTTTPVVLNQTVLLVARVHKNTDTTMTWALFVNPIVGDSEPGAAQAELTIPGAALPQAVMIYNDGGFSTDEIRLGTTWASVLQGDAPPCPADLDVNGIVDGADLGILLGNWGGTGTGDLDASGSVDGADLGALIGQWGLCE